MEVSGILRILQLSREFFWDEPGCLYLGYLGPLRGPLASLNHQNACIIAFSTSIPPLGLYCGPDLGLEGCLEPIRGTPSPVRSPSFLQDRPGLGGLGEDPKSRSTSMCTYVMYIFIYICIYTCIYIHIHI